MANFHVLTPGEAVHDKIEVRDVTLGDVFDALRRGYDDFMHKPSHYIFLVVLYPLIGLTLFAWAARGDTLQLIYPLVTGFALIGPIAALGLYEISRRREAGLDADWRHALSVVRTPAMASIAAVGIWLLLLFFLWIYAAMGIYAATFGGVEYETLGGLLGTVLSTPRGWALIILGNVAGFLFALAALCTTVVAFPLLLERDVGAVAAVTASTQAVLRNPVPMLVWGLIIAVSLFVGALPALGGLIVVLPILGHATWHIYRKAVRPPTGATKTRPAV